MPTTVHRSGIWSVLAIVFGAAVVIPSLAALALTIVAVALSAF